MHEWRPISEHDGSHEPVLVLYADVGVLKARIAYYVESEGHSGWWSYSTSVGATLVKPSAFMPLPAVPDYVKREAWSE